MVALTHSGACPSVPVDQDGLPEIGSRRGRPASRLMPEQAPMIRPTLTSDNSTAILPAPCWQSDPMWQHVARTRELRLVSELLPPPAGF